MGDVLVKNYDPATPPSGPYSVYHPGSPGVPPSPAYCIDVYEQEPQYRLECLLWDLPANPSLCLVPVLVPTGTNTRVLEAHNCYPATAGTPGVPATTTYVNGAPGSPANYYPGWNASARSVLTQAGDFAFDFYYDLTPVGVIAGVGQQFTDGETDTTQKVEFGWYLQNFQVQIIERGVVVTAATEAVAALIIFPTKGDVLTVQRTSGYISYWYNNVQVWISTEPPVFYPMFAIAWLYYGLDDIVDCDWGGPSPVDFSVYGGATPTVTGILFKTMGDVIGQAGYVNSVADTLLLDVTAPAGAQDPLLSDTSDIAGYEPGLNGWLGIPPQPPLLLPNINTGPQFCLVNGYLGQVQGFIVCHQSDNLPVHFADTLTPPLEPRFYNPDTTYPLLSSPFMTGGTATNTFGGLNGRLGAQLLGYSQQQNTYIVDKLFSTMRAEIGDDLGFDYTLSNFDNPYGTYQIYALGHQDTLVEYGFFGELQTPYSIRALGGAQAELTYDGFTLLASGTVTNLGTAYLLWPNDAPAAPNYPLMASGHAVNWGQAYLSYGSVLAIGGNYDVYGLGGAQGRLLYSGDWSLDGHAYAGNLGEADLVYGQFDYNVTASGSVWVGGVAAGTLPQLTIRNDVWSGTIVGPRFTIVAHGFSPGSTTEGYSMTLLGDNQKMEVATTHYTAYPFTRIVRFGSTYYGMQANGLYPLNDSTQGGNPIVAVIQTGESDMGHPTLKRTRRLYLAGRLSADLQVSVYSSELETDAYTYDPQIPIGGARNWRVALGRGIKARYLSYIITNTDGGDFEIQEIGPEVDILRRTA